MPTRRPRNVVFTLLLALVLLSLPSCAIGRIGLRATEAMLGEEDPELVAEALPAYLKAAEILAATWPDDEGYALAAAGMELLYASSFLAPESRSVPDSRWEERKRLVDRAGRLYARGASRAWAVLERRVPELRKRLASGDGSRLPRFRIKDVPALYYAAAGSLGAFSLDPFDPERAALLGPALALLERALELDPAWDRGALQSLLIQIAPSLPDELGGGYARAEAAYALAREYSRGLKADIHVAWARSVCVPRGDYDGFEAACLSALAVDPDALPEARLSNILSRREAEALLAAAEDIFLIF
ncbi:MAG: hypothetical protein JXA15_06110 [Spirochaetales bacterium]|nr:hypothetical protein [Spirochaetales bacterium]